MQIDQHALVCMASCWAATTLRASAASALSTPSKWCAFRPTHRVDLYQRQIWRLCTGQGVVRVTCPQAAMTCTASKSDTPCLMLLRCKGCLIDQFSSLSIRCLA